MFALIVGIIIFCAVLLVVAILAQNAKGGGLSSQFGGSGASNMFGVKKTGDFLEKATWTLAVTIIVLSLMTNLDFVSAGRSGGPSNEILDRAGEEAGGGQVAPSIPLPQQSDSAGQ